MYVYRRVSGIDCDDSSVHSEREDVFSVFGDDVLGENGCRCCRETDSQAERVISGKVFLSFFLLGGCFHGYAIAMDSFCGSAARRGLLLIDRFYFHSGARRYIMVSSS